MRMIATGYRSADPRGSSIAELIQASQAGNTRAFEHLYRLYVAALRRLCQRLASDTHHAEDLAQETFLHAFDRIGTFKEGMAFWPWLATIARNVAIDSARRRRQPQLELVEDVELGSDTDGSLLRSHRSQPEDIVAMRAALVGALSQLTPRERKIMWLHEVEEKTFGEIAHVVGTSVDAARNLAWRARATLRRRLTDLISLVPWPAGLSGSTRRAVRRLGGAVAGPCRTRLIAQEGGMYAQAAWALGALLLVSATTLPEPESVIRDEGVAPVLSTTEQVDPEPDVRGRSALRPAEPVSRTTQRHDPSVASIDANWRDDAATPESGRIRIEVRGNDQLLLASETEWGCHPHGPEGLPEEAPVHFYC